MLCIQIMGGVVVNRVRFIQGEDKHVKLFVKAPNDEPFTILSATYTLSRFGEVEAKGECDINGHYLDIKMEPKKKTKSYILEITYVVADSVRKARIEVEVI